MATEQVIHAVDDDRPFLAALERTLLETGMDVDCHESAAAFLASVDAARPGCLVTDLRMRDMDGLALQQRMKDLQIGMPVIFITGHGATRDAVTALKAGAVDFLEKPFRARDLLDSVRKALEKDAHDRLLENQRATLQQRFANLTPRERQVLALVVSDLPNKEVARQLKISPRTVEHHREHVMLKMQAHSATELLTMAVICGVRDLHL